MGRVFYSADRLGEPFEKIREIFFIVPDEQLRRQRSQYPKILIFLEGGCLVKAGEDFRERVEAGDVLIFPRPCVHYYASLEATREARLHVFSIFFRKASTTRKRGVRPKPGPAKDLAEMMPSLLSKTGHLRNALNPTLRFLINSFREEQDQARPGFQLKLQALAHSILVEVWRQLGDKPETGSIRKRNKSYVVNEVREFLIKSLGRPLTLGEIAWHVRWSEEHLSRVFKKETGTSVMDFLRHLRIDVARTRLLNTHQTVSTVASGLGFASLNNFCHTFKEFVGQTPTEYRENHEGERK